MSSEIHPYIKDPYYAWVPLSKPWHRNVLIVSSIFLIALGGLTASMYFGVLPNPESLHILKLTITLTKTTDFGLAIGGGAGSIITVGLASIAEHRRHKVVSNTTKKNVVIDELSDDE